MQQESILRFFTKANPSPPERSPSHNPKPGHPYQSPSDAESRSDSLDSRRGRSEYSRGHSRNHSSRRSTRAHSQHRSSRGSGRGHQHRGPNRRRNDDLKRIADETKEELPKILRALPGFDAAKSSLHRLEDTKPLDPLACPGHVLPPGDPCAGQKGTRIQVYDMDTLDAALQLSPEYKVWTHLRVPKPANTTPSSPSTSSHPPQPPPVQPPPTSPVQPPPTSPVLVLNLASERTPGGGWQKGALAQEETLCYRSSLSLSLHPTYYPLPPQSCIYTPSVLLLRSSLTTHHRLLTPHTSPPNLPALSILSLAALRAPRLTPDKSAFADPAHRTQTKQSIRLLLRLAASRGHVNLVLGALGCGVFANPPKEVAACFLQVLREPEFEGGWWESVVFAVLDNVKSGEGDGAADVRGGEQGHGNFGVFFRGLHGRIV